MFGSDQTDMYQGMMDDQMAVQLTSGRGIGLADMLFRQLSQGAGARGGAIEAAGSAQPEHFAIPEAQQRKFVEEMLPHARAAASSLGVDERSVLAQAALETGWGTAQPADAGGNSHNLFGIKAGEHWSGGRVMAETTEYRNGEARTERDAFRSYGDVAENVDDYVRVLSNNPRYAAALNTGADVRAFATGLQRGGYATDPNYAEKLVAVAAKRERLM
jgi:flagellar protein FlgJ